MASRTVLKVPAAGTVLLLNWWAFLRNTPPIPRLVRRPHAFAILSSNTSPLPHTYFQSSTLFKTKIIMGTNHPYNGTKTWSTLKL